MKKKLLPDLLLTEGIRSRLDQTTGQQRINGAIQTVARGLSRAEDRGFYANLLLHNFDVQFEPLGRQWHRSQDKDRLFARIFHKLGIRQEDQPEMQRAVTFLLKRYNKLYREGGYYDDDDIAEPWWGQIYIQIDDLYTLYKADADASDVKDYLRNHPRDEQKTEVNIVDDVDRLIRDAPRRGTGRSRVAEGIVSRTSQTDARVDGAIDLIARALADNYEFDPKTKIMIPRPVAIIDDLNEVFDHIIDKLHDEETWFDQSHKFGIKPKYQKAFMQALVFISQEYIAQLGDTSSAKWDVAISQLNDWYTAVLNQIESKYEAYRDDLTEGIVSRTSQSNARLEKAMDLIIKALVGSDFDRKNDIRVLDHLHDQFTHSINRQMEKSSLDAMMADGMDDDDEDLLRKWAKEYPPITKNTFAKEFNLKPQHVDIFFQAFSFFVAEYIRRAGSAGTRRWAEDANEWYEEKMEQLEWKYEAYRSS